MAAHWYTRAGVLQEGAGLRRARTEDLLPSVTTIQDMIAKPDLQVWIEREGIRAALRSPLQGSEHEEDAIRRIKAERWQSGEKIRSLGTMVHAELEKVLADWPRREALLPDPPLRGLVEPVVRWIELTYPEADTVLAERRVTHNLGYAGTADALVQQGPFAALLDFKTQRPKNGALKTWPEWAEQLAAYQRALGFSGTDCRCWSIVIDVTGELHGEDKHLFYAWPDAGIERGWRAFAATLNAHQVRHEYYGGWDTHLVQPDGTCAAPAQDLEGLL